MILTHKNRITRDEKEDIETIFLRSSKTGTQTPLYASIMISPLILLLPIKLPALKWAKNKMIEVNAHSACIIRVILTTIQTWKQLGNDKPKCIIDIENMIWQTVLNISLGEMSCVNALKKLISSLPHSLMLDITTDHTVRTWFKLNTVETPLTVSPTTNTIASTHLEDNESTVGNEKIISAQNEYCASPSKPISLPISPQQAHLTYKELSDATSTDDNGRMDTSTCAETSHLQEDFSMIRTHPTDTYNSPHLINEPPTIVQQQSRDNDYMTDVHIHKEQPPLRTYYSGSSIIMSENAYIRLIWHSKNQPPKTIPNREANI